MRQEHCSSTQGIVDALRKDVLSDELQAHLESCSQCREVAGLVRTLRADAHSSVPIPPFETLRWRIRGRAILDASQRRNRSATWPLRAFHVAAGSLLLVAMLILTVAPIADPGSFGGLVSAGPLPALLMGTLGVFLLVEGRESPGTVDRV